MAVFRDKWDGYEGASWRVVVYYKDWKGIRRRHEKRGFPTKKEAVRYEKEFIAKTGKDLSMGFSTFIDIYLDDIRPHVKPTTYATKVNVIDTHIRPYFQEKSLGEITPSDILQWQNELLGTRDEQGKGYSRTYLRTIENQLSAIFNHAVRYYDLPKNPEKQVKKMGKGKAGEMMFWTQDEYGKFADAMKDKPLAYYAFEVLYWTGVRAGELLALTREDFDLEARTLRVNKNYQVVHGEEMITTPKTEKSIRTIDLPEFLCEEMEDYFGSLTKLDAQTRFFPVTKSYLHHELDYGAKKAGVKRIRLHDLRHSSCALLIHLGYSPTQIAERLGHESATITARYAHLYPSVQKQMAEKLNEVGRREEEDNGEKK